MITDKEIKKIMNEPLMKLALEALDKYDNRYIGNVSKETAKKLFPEMFKNVRKRK